MFFVFNSFDRIFIHIFIYLQPPVDALFIYLMSLIILYSTFTNIFLQFSATLIFS